MMVIYQILSLIEPAGCVAITLLTITDPVVSHVRSPVFM